MTEPPAPRGALDDTAPVVDHARARAETKPPPAVDATATRASGRYLLLAARRDHDTEVIDAFDPRLTRNVRIFRSLTPTTPDQTARFLRGALIAAHLEHPSVTCILDLGVDAEGHAYFVTPRRAAAGLEGWLARGLTLGRRLTAMEEICRVIAYAHQRGVIHGRLDASALGFGEIGEVEVGRWDVAVVPPSLQTAHGRFPIAAAGSPDQERPTERQDVAALGRILAQVLGDDRDLAPELTQVTQAATTGAGTPALTAAGLAQQISRFLDGELDVALRQQMAEHQVNVARAELAQPGGDRERAIRAARQALALAPASDQAAALVGRLMIEVPSTLPPEAQLAAERSDQRVIQEMGTPVIAAFTAFLLYVPLMFLQGVRSPVMVVAIGSMATIMLVWAWRWRAVGPHVYTWPPMLGTAMLLLLYSRTLGPFVNAPAELALAAMAVSFFPSGPRWGVVATVFGAPAIALWLLERLGVLATTTFVSSGRLQITSPVVEISAVPHYIGMTFVSIVLITVSGGLAGHLSISHRRMLRRIVRHNWMVRAIAASPATGSRDPERG